MIVRSLRAFCQMSSLALGLLTVAVALCIGLFLSGQIVLRADRPPVLSLATLQGDLQRDPAAWLGRLVRVRAVAVQCQAWFTEPDSCFQWQPSLIDALDATTSALPLVA